MAGPAVNSIVAARGDRPVQDGDDGVVKSASAHIDGVESEWGVWSAARERPAQRPPHAPFCHVCVL